jgi:hypothetical protein
MKNIFLQITLTILSIQNIALAGDTADAARNELKQIDSINCLREIDQADLYYKKTEQRLSPLNNKSISICKKTVLEMMDLSNVPDDHELEVFTSCGTKLQQDYICYSFVGVGLRHFSLHDVIPADISYWDRDKHFPEYMFSGVTLYSKKEDMDKAKISSLKKAIAEFKAYPYKMWPYLIFK